MHPEIIARFREQGFQIDQIAGDFPEEVMMAAIGMLAEAADRNIEEVPAEERRMPGGEIEFGHEDGDREHDESADDLAESDDDEVEEEDEQYVSGSCDLRLIFHAHISFSHSLRGSCGPLGVVYGVAPLRQMNHLIQIQTMKVPRLGQTWGQDRTMWTNLGVSVKSIRQVCFLR